MSARAVVAKRFFPGPGLGASATYVTQLRGHFTVVFVSVGNVAGARQVHQYRYAQTTGADGRYARLAVDSAFPRFPFAGVFVNIGDRERGGTVDDL